MTQDYKSAQRQAPDALLGAIADYVLSADPHSELAYETAYHCFIDTIGCGLQALKYPACTKLLGPVVPGATLRGGVRVPGTDWELDPVTAAFNIGTIIRWLDFNDTWLAAEWGHLSRSHGADTARGPSVRTVLRSMIQAHEIQGVLALENSFNRIGLDHVLLVRIASTAVIAAMLGATREQIINAVSNAWIDGGALRTYRHAPNTGSRKSWAAGDATSRAVWHALIALRGEMGYPSALSAPTWGFCDVLNRGRELSLPQSFGSYVMENVLFKISYPAEFHAQTAVEAAMQLHAAVAPRLDEIERVLIETQEPGLRIIDKTGPLDNPADRDHCLQYMIAIPLIFGRLSASDYEQQVAGDPRIDTLRARMQVRENPDFTRDYYDASKRYIGNAIQVVFRDASVTARVAIDFPIGHRRRRAEGLPLLQRKFQNAVADHYAGDKAARIVQLFNDRERLEVTAVSELMSTLSNS
jgi:2-methylcitrate dehydratase